MQDTGVLPVGDLHSVDNWQLVSLWLRVKCVGSVWRGDECVFMFIKRVWHRMWGCVCVFSHASLVLSDVFVLCEQPLNTFTCASISLCTQNIYMTSLWEANGNRVSCTLISSSRQTTTRGCAFGGWRRKADKHNYLWLQHNVVILNDPLYCRLMALPSQGTVGPKPTGRKLFCGHLELQYFMYYLGLKSFLLLGLQHTTVL